jgi:transcriptional regulator with XRE-family HTH domain
MRLDANVSMRALATVTGVHPSTISRVEAGLIQPSLDVLIAIGIALGADLSLKYFDGSGPRLHDRVQAPMVEAFIRALDPRWKVDLEVPISHPARGIIDIVLADRGRPVRVSGEAYSDLRRLEQQIRWSAEKADGLRERLALDGAPHDVSRLSILRSTATTRALAS